MDFDRDFERAPERKRPHNRPPQRTRTRWNYKRIAVATVALVCVSTVAVYGGYSLAHFLSSPKSEKKIAGKNVQINATNFKAAKTTTTTEINYVQYEVKSGDTFYGIALEYKLSVKELMDFNKVKSDDLQVGMVLRVPVKEDTKTSAAKDEKKDDDKKAEEPVKDQNITGIKASAQEVYRGPMDAKQVALTFDAGAVSEATPKILKALKDADVRATFFLTGKWIDDNPELTKQIAEDGHVIGNHTYNHPDMTKLNDDQIAHQLESTDELIQQNAGFSSKPMFRFPYGSRDERVLRAISAAGYRSIYWTTDSLDWKTEMTPEKVKARVLGGLGNGSIILLHCGSEKTAEALPELIEAIESRGYNLATIPELFE